MSMKPMRQPPSFGQQLLPGSKCTCCPYGYHIDNSFVNYAQQVSHSSKSRTSRSFHSMKKSQQSRQNGNSRALFDELEQSFSEINASLNSLNMPPPPVYIDADDTFATFGTTHTTTTRKGGKIIETTNTCCHEENFNSHADESLLDCNSEAEHSLLEQENNNMHLEEDNFDEFENKVEEVQNNNTYDDRTNEVNNKLKELEQTINNLKEENAHLRQQNEQNKIIKPSPAPPSELRRTTDGGDYLIIPEDSGVVHAPSPEQTKLDPSEVRWPKLTDDPRVKRQPGVERGVKVNEYIEKSVNDVVETPLSFDWMFPHKEIETERPFSKIFSNNVMSDGNDGALEEIIDDEGTGIVKLENEKEDKTKTKVPPSDVFIPKPLDVKLTPPPREKRKVIDESFDFIKNPVVETPLDFSWMTPCKSTVTDPPKSCDFGHNVMGSGDDGVLEEKIFNEGNTVVHTALVENGDDLPPKGKHSIETVDIPFMGDDPSINLGSDDSYTKYRKVEEVIDLIKNDVVETAPSSFVWMTPDKSVGTDNEDIYIVNRADQRENSTQFDNSIFIVDAFSSTDSTIDPTKKICHNANVGIETVLVTIGVGDGIVDYEDLTPPSIITKSVSHMAVQVEESARPSLVNSFTEPNTDHFLSRSMHVQCDSTGTKVTSTQSDIVSYSSSHVHSDSPGTKSQCVQVNEPPPVIQEIPEVNVNVNSMHTQCETLDYSEYGVQAVVDVADETSQYVATGNQNASTVTSSLFMESYEKSLRESSKEREEVVRLRELITHLESKVLIYEEKITVLRQEISLKNVVVSKRNVGLTVRPSCRDVCLNYVFEPPKPDTRSVGLGVDTREISPDSEVSYSNTTVINQRYSAQTMIQYLHRTYGISISELVKLITELLKRDVKSVGFQVTPESRTISINTHTVNDRVSRGTGDESMTIDAKVMGTGQSRDAWTSVKTAPMPSKFAYTDKVYCYDAATNTCRQSCTSTLDQESNIYNSRESILSDVAPDDVFKSSTTSTLNTALRSRNEVVDDSQNVTTIKNITIRLGDSTDNNDTTDVQTVTVRDLSDKDTEPESNEQRTVEESESVAVSDDGSTTVTKTTTRIQRISSTKVQNLDSSNLASVNDLDFAFQTRRVGDTYVRTQLKKMDVSPFKTFNEETESNVAKNSFSFQRELLEKSLSNQSLTDLDDKKSYKTALQSYKDEIASSSASSQKVTEIHQTSTQQQYNSSSQSSSDFRVENVEPLKLDDKSNTSYSISSVRHETKSTSSIPILSPKKEFSKATVVESEFANSKDETSALQQSSQKHLIKDIRAESGVHTLGILPLKSTTTAIESDEASSSSLQQSSTSSTQITSRKQVSRTSRESTGSFLPRPRGIMKTQEAAPLDSPKKEVKFDRFVIGGVPSSPSDSEDDDADSIVEGSYFGTDGSIVPECAEGSDNEEEAEEPSAGSQPSTPSFVIPPDVEKACLTFKTWCQDSTTITAKELNETLSLIRREWFRISSNKEATAAQTQFYLEYFHSVSPQLVEKVINICDDNGNTSLHYSVSQGNWDVVQTLLETHCLDVDKTNRSGFSALMLAGLCHMPGAGTKQGTLRTLLKSGDLNRKATTAGQTALMLAASHGRVEVLRLLLELGADANLQDDEGSTALMCAADHGQLECVRALLHHPGIQTDLQDNEGATALTVAMESGHRDAALLIYAKANLPNRGTVKNKKALRKRYQQLQKRPGSSLIPQRSSSASASENDED